MTEHPKKTVLIVDDNEDNRCITARMLRPAGFEIWEAATGAEALRQAALGPNLVILDVNLPDLNGLEVCRRLKTNPVTCHIPVLHLSATFVHPSDRAAGIEGGAAGYLVQPVDRKELIATVNGLLRVAEMERKLRAERDRAQRYLDAVETIIVALDSEGRITLVNRKGCKLLGCGEDEILGQSWFSMCLPQPDGMKNVYPVFLRLMAGELEALEYFENPIVTRSGELRQIAWHNALLRDEHGRIAGTLSSGDDITERRRVEDALRKSEEDHRTILRTAMDGFWQTDMQGRLLDVNAAYCRMSGYSEPELLAMRIPDLEAVETSDDTAAHIHKVMARGEERFETRHRRKDGSIFDVEVSAHYRPIAGGQILSFLRDITERKRAEELLIREKSFADSAVSHHRLKAVAWLNH